MGHAELKHLTKCIELCTFKATKEVQYVGEAEVDVPPLVVQMVREPYSYWKSRFNYACAHPPTARHRRLWHTHGA